MQSDPIEIAEKISRLQTENARLSILVSRLDSSIEKFSDVSGNVASMIAVLEERMKNQQRSYNERNEHFEKSIDAINKDIEFLKKNVWWAIGAGFVTIILLKIFFGV